MIRRYGKGLSIALRKAMVLSVGFGMLFMGFCVPAMARDSVPEIDAGSMGSALTLLTGGLLILTARRGRK
jgi:hypothetical protein